MTVILITISFFFYLLGKMLHDSLLFKRELIDNE